MKMNIVFKKPLKILKWLVKLPESKVGIITFMEPED